MRDLTDLCCVHPSIKRRNNHFHYIAESAGAHALALNLAEGCSALLPAVHGFSKRVGTSESNSVRPNLWFSVVP